MAGNGASSSVTKGSDVFFKILLADFEDRLRVPDAFVEYMVHQLEELSGTITLHGPSGNCWNVKIKKTDKGVYFEDGWEIFSSDHTLAYCQVLVFRYLGRMHFKVQIFDRTTCEREDAFTVEPSDGATREYQSESRHALGVGKPSGAERMMIDAAHPLTSPHFVIHLKPSNVGHPYNLTVPSKFAKEFLPQYTTSLLLKDGNETTTEVTFYVRKKQACLTSGWKSVVVDNDLHVGDRCVFELLRKNLLRVHTPKRYGEISSHHSGDDDGESS